MGQSDATPYAVGKSKWANYSNASQKLPRDTVFLRIIARGDYSRDGYYWKKYRSLPQTLRMAESLESLPGDTFLTKTLDKRIFHFQIDKSY